MGSELKHIARRLSRSPMFTAIALVTLAVGIGANTAIFTVIDSVLLKPLPFPESDRLVAVWQAAPGLGLNDVNASPATYFTYREEGRVFQDIGLWQVESVAVTGLAEPENVQALVVTEGTLPLLGIRPFRGRWFTRNDDSPGAPETVMLTYGYWQRRFGGDSAILRRRIILDGQAYEVIGILPREFRFLSFNPALIRPFQFDRSKVVIGNFSYQAVARLKPGATLAQANADVARMLPIMTQKFRPLAGVSADVLKQARFGPRVRPLKQDATGDVGNVLWVLMATVGIVLFIACANVANLLLVRAEGRQHELAVRAALGASRGRIARELLLESVTLGIAGGAIGLGLAQAALRVLVFLKPAGLPRLAEVSIDAPVLLFTLAVSLVSGVLFGLMPVLKYAGPRVGVRLREGGRTLSDSRERHRARSTLVVVQVGLARVLLIGSGLMIRTLQALKRVQPGFTSPEQIQTLRVSIPDAAAPEAERALRMHNDIIEKIATIPGVAAVGGSNSITMDGETDNDPVYVDDRPGSERSLPPLRRFRFISPGLFRAMGNPLLAGRDFTWADLYQRRAVVIVSDNFAREYWQDPASALGKRIRENPKGVWREIIGVAGDERDDGVDQKAPTIVYLPLLVNDYWQYPSRVQRTVAFAVRSGRAGSATLLNDIRRAVWSVNPDLPLADVRTVREIYGNSMARTSFTLVMLAVAAAMAMLLGVVGIYGVISYSVSQRMREIGIRIALGAEQGSVRRMFVRYGLALAGVGLGCGLVAAVLVMRLLSKLLFEVRPVDPATYGAVSVVLLAAALLASYVPARRATAVQPVDALRAE